jgi:hypothetical protein
VNAWFGNSVSIFGDYALVGAPLNNGKESNSGSAYIFKKEGLNWNQGTKLTASDGVSGDFFGTSVSITNDYLIIGASGDDNNGTSTGAAYIFKRNGEDWIEQVKLTADDGTAYDWFGNSVSIDSGFAIVGAFLNDENGMDCGSAYLYKRDQSTWIKDVKLTASDGSEQSWFGESISLSGDNIIVGAIFDKEKGYQAGAAYFYTGFITVGITDFSDYNSMFLLEQNYPNPLNPVTTISFYIPSTSFVSLIIIDQLGREVTTLISENLPVGKYSRQWNAIGMASGVYFYRIQAGDFTETKKLILMR